MSDDAQNLLAQESHVIEALKAELEKAEPSKRSRILEKFFLAVLSSIPWVGGVLSAAESYRSEAGNLKVNHLQTQWLEEHQRKIALLAATLDEIRHRFESIGEDIDERLQSEEYLAIVRKAFRAWDQAETEEKRHLLANAVTNAASTRVCSDDVIRLFIDWISLYNEIFFAVIREIYKNPACSRYEIWTNLYGAIPREDSAEADLFKFLIRELSTGSVIRQPRDTNEYGQYRKKPAVRRPGLKVLKSAFDDQESYVLTALGKQFVHYTMSEIVARITAGSGPAQE
jgi:hypothetical protein